MTFIYYLIYLLEFLFKTTVLVIINRLYSLYFVVKISTMINYDLSIILYEAVENDQKLDSLYVRRAKLLRFQFRLKSERLYTTNKSLTKRINKVLVTMTYPTKYTI